MGEEWARGRMLGRERERACKEGGHTTGKGGGWDWGDRATVRGRKSLRTEQEATQGVVDSYISVCFQPVADLGLRVEGVGFRISGVRFRAYGVGSRVQGLVLEGGRITGDAISFF